MGSQHMQTNLKIDKTILSSGKYYFIFLLISKSMDVIPPGLPLASFSYPDAFV